MRGATCGALVRVRSIYNCTHEHVAHIALMDGNGPKKGCARVVVYVHIHKVYIYIRVVRCTIVCER